MKKLLLTLTAAALATGSALADHHGKKLDPAKADVKVTINGNDQMQFDKTEIEAKAGQIVAITFKNIGNLPVEAMGHNLVVLKPDTNVVNFAMDGIQNKAGGFLPNKADLKAAIVANTKILGPKQEETIVFKVAEPGEYPYLCTFPGHFGVMKGVLKVAK